MVLQGEAPAIENHFVVDITDNIKTSHLQAIKDVKNSFEQFAQKILNCGKFTFLLMKTIINRRSLIDNLNKLILDEISKAKNLFHQMIFPKTSTTFKDHPHHRATAAACHHW